MVDEDVRVMVGKYLNKFWLLFIERVIKEVEMVLMGLVIIVVVI